MEPGDRAPASIHEALGSIARTEEEVEKEGGWGSTGRSHVYLEKKIKPVAECCSKAGQLKKPGMAVMSVLTQKAEEEGS